MIPPGQPLVKGIAAIEEYWKGALELGGVRNVSVKTMDAYSSRALGYETGSVELTVSGFNGEAVIHKGHILNCLSAIIMADGSPLMEFGIRHLRQISK